VQDEATIVVVVERGCGREGKGVERGTKEVCFHLEREDEKREW